MVPNFFKCDHSGRMSGDERRMQILEAAANLFSVNGFRGTTTKEIARDAGVSEALVFRHFATKDKLYEAILDARACRNGLDQFPWEKNEKIIKAIEEGDDRAVFFNVALDALNKQQSDVAFMRLIFYSALEEHELSERFFGEYVSRIYEFVGGYIKRRQAEGAMREMDPRIAVRVLIGTIVHHSLNNILWDKERKVLNISNEEAASEFADVLLRGILNK